MDSNVHFFELTINTLHSEFFKISKANLPSVDNDLSDSLISYKAPLEQGGIQLPSFLLQSTCVILSIWNDQKVSDESKIAVESMANVLLYRDNNDVDGTRSLTRVDILGEGRSVISVENV